MLRTILVKDEDTKDRLWKSVISIREKSLLQEEIEHLKDELEGSMILIRS